MISHVKTIVLLLFCFSLSCEDKGSGLPEPPGGGPEPPIMPLYFDHPAWHPGGEWIAAEHVDSIDSNGDGKRDRGFAGIWLVHAVTGERQPLLDMAGLPAWNPDGKRLAMIRGTQIFSMKVASFQPAWVDSNSITQLTTEGKNFYPSWSPDGEWLVFDSNNESPNGMYFLWIMKADGSEKRRIAYDPAMGEIRIPHWSKNGKIAHIRYVGVTFPEVFSMDSNGTNATRLTFNDANDRHPKYSPDGSKIAFYSQPRTGPPSLWIMNSDGSDQRKIFPEYTWRFDWSPDGNKLVFLYWDFLLQRAGGGELWLINSEGTGLRQLTHFRSN